MFWNRQRTLRRNRIWAGCMANDLLAFYTSFKGRATRSDFNIRYALVVFVGGVVASIADYVFFGGSEYYLSKIWNVFAIIASLSVTCRRLHDMNYSGWWQLFVHMVPTAMLVVLFMTVGMAFLTNPLAAGLGGFLAILAILIFYLLFFIFLSAKRGTIGPNKYGADPLQTPTIETTI